MKTVLYLCQIMRLPNCLMSALVVVTAAHLLPSPPALGRLVYAALGAFMLTAYGNIHNDIFDLEADRHNHPERPLPTGRLEKGLARVWLIVCLSVGLLSSFFLTPACFRIAVSVSVMLFFYNIAIKRIIFFSNIWVGVMAGLSFIYAGYLSPYFRIHDYDLVIAGALFAFCFHLGREIIKDLQDCDGDLATGVRTLGNTGPSWFAKLLATAAFVPVLGQGFLIHFFLKPGWEFLVIFIIGTALPILILTGMLWRSTSPRDYRIIAAGLKALIPLGLVALLVARYALPLDSL